MSTHARGQASRSHTVGPSRAARPRGPLPQQPWPSHRARSVPFPKGVIGTTRLSLHMAFFLLRVCLRFLHTFSWFDSFLLSFLMHVFILCSFGCTGPLVLWLRQLGLHALQWPLVAEHALWARA